MSPDRPLSRASSLPPDRGQTQIPGTPDKPVGASLLAMRPAHPTPMSPDRPPSRASSLPQGITARHRSRGRPINLWERACSR
ncbi:hypothetical protein PSJE_24135 [Pseudomonas jessenii]|nr:hypothetical protein PSJE_24135 [Pseudomonas jessenii]